MPTNHSNGLARQQGTADTATFMAYTDQEQSAVAEKEFKKLSVLINKHLHKQLKRHAAERECTITELILGLLRDHLDEGKDRDMHGSAQ